MYEVIIYDGIEDEAGTVIHTPFGRDVKIVSGKVKQVLGGISNMEFTITLNNPAWGRIRPLKTLIRVRDIKRNKSVFYGRVLKPTQKMSSNGAHYMTYACESILAYLYDSNQRWGEYHNISVRDFLREIVENHNRQVEPHKRFKVGNVTVTDSNDSLYRYLGYEKTYETIKDKLVNRLGGFIVLREESDGNYIDYLESVGEHSATPIKIAKNLKDLEREIDPTDIITRLVVLGARIESGDEDNVEASQPRLTMETVNGGKDYIDDPELIKEFGIIEGTLTFDDVTQPSYLLLRGQQFFQSQKAAKVSYTINAVDLNLIDASFDEFELGNWYPIENRILNIGETAQIVEKTIDVLYPTNNSFVIGEKHKSLSQYQIEAVKNTRTIDEMQSTVAQQAQTIGTLRSELQEVNTAVATVWEALSEADLPALEQAITDLNTAIENLQTVIDSLPTYDLATPTSPGLMSAEDKSKIDRITAINAVDLDAVQANLAAMSNELSDLITRVDALEQQGGQA